MTRPSAPQRLPLDLELDGSPDLTAGDQTAIEAIRRQLAEEYPGASDQPARVDPRPPALVPRARSRRAWSSPLVATLVMLSGVGGGVVGSLVALQLLRDPEVVTSGAIAASPGGSPGEAPTTPALMPEPGVPARTPVDPQAPASGRQPASLAAARSAPPELPPRAETRRPPASRAEAQMGGAPAPPPGPRLLPKPPASPANGIPRRAPVGVDALPEPAPLVANPVPAPPPVPAAGAPVPPRAPATDVTPRAPVPASGVLQAAPGAAGTRPSAPPEVNGGAAGTKSSAPLEANGDAAGGNSSATPEANGGAADAKSSTEGNGRAADAKSSASAAPKTDAAYGKIVGVSLGAGRDTPSTMSPAASPTPEPAAAEPPPRPTSRRPMTLRESLRQDWDAARRGLESAPAELERAWRSFTRDVKGLFDR